MFTLEVASFSRGSRELKCVLCGKPKQRARRGRRLPGRGGGARAPNTRRRVLSRECPQTAPLGSSGSVRHAGVAGSVELIHKEMKTMRWEVTGQKALG